MRYPSRRPRSNRSPFRWNSYNMSMLHIAARFQSVVLSEEENAATRAARDLFNLFNNRSAFNVVALPVQNRRPDFTLNERLDIPSSPFKGVAVSQEHIATVLDASAKGIESILKLRRFCPRGVCACWKRGDDVCAIGLAISNSRELSNSRLATSVIFASEGVRVFFASLARGH